MVMPRLTLLLIHAIYPSSLQAWRRQAWRHKAEVRGILANGKVTKNRSYDSNATLATSNVPRDYQREFLTSARKHAALYEMVKRNLSLPHSIKMIEDGSVRDLFRAFIEAHTEEITTAPNKDKGKTHDNFMKGLERTVQNILGLLRQTRDDFIHVGLDCAGVLFQRWSKPEGDMMPQADSVLLDLVQRKDVSVFLVSYSGHKRAKKVEDVTLHNIFKEKGGIPVPPENRFVGIPARSLKAPIARLLKLDAMVDDQFEETLLPMITLSQHPTKAWLPHPFVAFWFTRDFALPGKERDPKAKTRYDKDLAVWRQSHQSAIQCPLNFEDPQWIAWTARTRQRKLSKEPKK